MLLPHNLVVVVVVVVVVTCTLPHILPGAGDVHAAWCWCLVLVV